MNKKENPLSKTTLSFRTTKEEDALYKELAEKLGMSYAQYLAMMMRKAHEEMFNRNPKEDVEENILEEEKEEVVEKKEQLPMSNEEMERLLGKASKSNLDFLVSNHLETQKKKHAEQLEKTKVEVAEQTAKETETNVCQKIRDENLVIPASKELIEVFNMFVEHNKNRDRIKNGYELILKLIDNEIFWDREPEIEEELMKKAKSKEYLNKPE